jgi:hypothetical protein
MIPAHDGHRTVELLQWSQEMRSTAEIGASFKRECRLIHPINFDRYITALKKNLAVLSHR